MLWMFALEETVSVIVYTLQKRWRLKGIPLNATTVSDANFLEKTKLWTLGNISKNTGITLQ